MKSSLLAELDKEINETKARLAALEAAKAALSGAPVADAAAPVAKPSRAPAGALRNCILAVLKGKMTPKEIRDAVKASGYRFAIDPTAQSKLLAQLVEEKEVKKDGEGCYSRA